MTHPTHLITGLIIGQVTGDYPTALATSLLIDLDHLAAYARKNILFSPARLIQASLVSDDSANDQRSIFHSFTAASIITFLIAILLPQLALTFGLAYFLHLVLDLLDDSPVSPWIPFNHSLYVGPIRYYSHQELNLFLLLLIIFLSLFLIK